ncbi:MAG: CinA family protein [Thermoplasmatota archaeon]
MNLTWERLVEASVSKGLLLSAVESCTGGLVSSLITDVPGASKAYLGGLSAYSNDLKISLAGVDEDTLIGNGAVSPDTAREMAEGFLRISGADITLSVTGIAGPTGGTDEKPVGTVYIGIAVKGGETHVEGFFLPGLTRTGFKEEVAKRALSMILATVDGL